MPSLALPRPSRRCAVHRRCLHRPSLRGVAGLRFKDGVDRLSRRGHLTEGGDLVFVGTSGGHINYNATVTAFYAALRKAGLGHLREQDSPVRFHDLRHTFGTRLAAEWESSPSTWCRSWRPRSSVRSWLFRLL
jgi:integrase